MRKKFLDAIRRSSAAANELIGSLKETLTANNEFTILGMRTLLEERFTDIEESCTCPLCRTRRLSIVIALKVLRDTEIPPGVRRKLGLYLILMNAALAMTADTLNAESKLLTKLLEEAVVVPIPKQALESFMNQITASDEDNKPN